MSKIITLSLSLCILVICLHSNDCATLKVHKRQVPHVYEDYAYNDYTGRDPNSLEDTVKRQIQPDNENSLNEVDSEYADEYVNQRNDNVDNWTTVSTKRPFYYVDDKKTTDYEPIPWYKNVANFAQTNWGKAVDKVKSWGKRKRASFMSKMSFSKPTITKTLFPHQNKHTIKPVSQTTTTTPRPSTNADTVWSSEESDSTTISPEDEEWLLRMVKEQEEHLKSFQQ